MTSTTFQALDPTTGATFGEQIAEMDESQVESLISKAANQVNTLASATPTKRAALLREKPIKVWVWLRFLLQVISHMPFP